MTSGYTAELGEQDNSSTSKMTFPVQREGGYVSHWSWRYLVVGEISSLKGCLETSHQDKSFLS